MKRYDLELCYGDSDRCYAKMIENPTGDYVEHTAAAARISELEGKLAEANSKAQTYSDLYRDANASALELRDAYEKQAALTPPTKEAP